jgi:uncharacterized membrane protein
MTDTAAILFLPVLLAVHIVSVVLWIGGLAFVTTVVLPALVRLPVDQRIPAFLEIERRFGLQARVLVLVAGASGAEMLMRMHLVGLLGNVRGLWLDDMIGFWTFFVILLFVLEPMVLHRRLRERGTRHGEATRVMLLRGHMILLMLALVVITAAVLGAHGVG